MKTQWAFLLLFLLLISVLRAQGFETSFVDIDSVARKFKLEITYNELTGDILLTDKKHQVRLVQGFDFFECNQKNYSLPKPIYMRSGQVYVSYKLVDVLTRLQQETFSRESRSAQTLSADFTVVIDPGHGGKDPGTEGLSSAEKNVTLNVALLLKEQLQQMGATVLLTRENDIFIPLPERPLVASTSSADVFISLHMNASKDRTAEGVEVFVYRYQDQDFEKNRTSLINQNISFKKSLLSDDCYLSMGIERDIMRIQLLGNVDLSYQFADSILKNLLNIGSITSRGIKEANFVVLRNATCPAVLVEMGFLSHSATESKFLTNSYCRSIAESIAIGIAKYGRNK